MNFLKKYWVWILVIAIIVIAVFAYLKNKQKKQLSKIKGELNGSKANGTGYRGSWPVGYIEKKYGTAFAVSLKNRPPEGTIVTGDTVLIENSGPYSGNHPIISTWIDSAGNVGAIYINIPGSAGVPLNSQESTFEDIGTINLI